MKIAVFSTKPHDRRGLEAANAAGNHELYFHEARLRPHSSRLAENRDAVCVFVNDELSEESIADLAGYGVRFIALRCAGFNNVDLTAAAKYGLQVVRVPAYSPYSVAEHAVALILTLNRRVHKAYNRVREGNFELRGLEGFDLHGKTVGVVGTGNIGKVFCRIMNGFGCRVLAFDPFPNPDCEALGVEYVALEELLGQSDIVSLHCPLSPQTHHLINANSLEQMKQGAMLVNTSRGGLVDTPALIGALKSGRIGGLALDVYEEEADLFFEDLSGEIIDDDLLMRLTTFPNVLITSHQAFFTHEALREIAETTLRNLTDLENGRSCPNQVVAV
tara:strand:+ start:966 stop:1961 length:996 start_codon:yes stop_codon:yes gene_type:complete